MNTTDKLYVIHVSAAILDQPAPNLEAVAKHACANRAALVFEFEGRLQVGLGGEDLGQHPEIVRWLQGAARQPCADHLKQHLLYEGGDETAKFVARFGHVPFGVICWGAATGDTFEVNGSWWSADCTPEGIRVSEVAPPAEMVRH